jgi:hypothetical protein
MAIPAHSKLGCSPWALMGCGCGLLSGVGILLVFFVLGVQMVHARHDTTWSRPALVQCQDNLRVLRDALASYQRDYHHLPARLEDLNPSYLDSPARLRCPLETLGHGTPYQYNPQAKKPTDALITCTNHGQGTIALQVNGFIRLPNIFPKKSKE